LPKLRYPILGAQREGSRALNEALRPLGLTAAQAEVLTVVRETGGSLTSGDDGAMTTRLADIAGFHITSGEGDAMLDAPLCTTEPGEEVTLTNPTYAGMLNRMRLVGAVPKLVPLTVETGEWRLDLDALRAAPGDRTSAIFINNASFPRVGSAEELEAIAAICRERDIRLIYWGAYEGVLYDGCEVLHPSSFDGMRDRTVTIGVLAGLTAPDVGVAAATPSWRAAATRRCATSTASPR
jgi:DNA-binding transcriptional MocR family regulator